MKNTNFLSYFQTFENIYLNAQITDAVQATIRRIISEVEKNLKATQTFVVLTVHNKIVDTLARYKDF